MQQEQRKDYINKYLANDKDNISNFVDSIENAKTVDTRRKIESNLTSAELMKKFKISKTVEKKRKNVSEKYVKDGNKNQSREQMSQKLGVNTGTNNNKSASDSSKSKQVSNSSTNNAAVTKTGKVAKTGTNTVKKVISKKNNKNDGNTYKVLDRVIGKIPIIKHMSFFEDDYNSVDFGESMESSIRKKILTVSMFSLVLIIIMLLFFLIIYIVITPLSYFENFFDESIKENPQYIGNVISEKNQEFQANIDNFRVSNQYNTVEYAENNKFNNTNDIIATYLAIVCEKNLNEPDEENVMNVTQDFLVIDTPTEKEILDKIYSEYNYTEKRSNKVTVKETVPHTVNKEKIVKNNLIKQHPLSTGNGKNLNKEYFFSIDDDCYYKVFGNYVTADMLQDLSFTWIPEATKWVTLKSGNRYYETVGSLKYSWEETEYEEKEEVKECEILKIYQIDMNRWKSLHLSEYNDTINDFLEMEEEYVADAQFYNTEGVDTGALSDGDFNAMWNVAQTCLGTPYVMGGSDPATGMLDCSGFVCYVINNSNVLGHSIGRTDTNGLLRLTTTFTNYDDVRPGDLIFFQGTYDYPGASHVGIVIGNGNMVHSGNPCQVKNFKDNTYWQQHFMCYGRLNK